MRGNKKRHVDTSGGSRLNGAGCMEGNSLVVVNKTAYPPNAMIHEHSEAVF